MPQFGKTSQKRLCTAHPVLVELFKRVIEHRDCSITEGHRGMEAQKYVFSRGLSKVDWSDSKHNLIPSLAVDAVPWPEKWSSEKAFLELRIIIQQEWPKMKQEGATEGYRLRWGGDWDMDGDRNDQSFHDLPHWELIK